MGIIEFSMWVIYYTENPFGDARQDLQLALLSKNLLAPYSKGEIALKDLMLIKPGKKSEEAQKRPSPQQLTKIVQGYMRVLRNNG